MNQNSKSIVAACFLVALTASGGCHFPALKSPLRNPTILAPQPKSLVTWHESYDSALAESQATGKPILADFTGSDWCHWCVKLKQDVFETTTFTNWAKDNVVLLELDYPRRGVQAADIKQQNKDLADRYKITSYPTVLFLDSEGKVIGKLGYIKEPADWVANAEGQIASAATLAE